jgi:diguanylate cyclase (GGDEF)-like protein/PAS domain S-box-containing protein
MKNKTRTKSINKKQVKAVKKEIPTSRKSLLSKKKKNEETGKNKPGLKDFATLRKRSTKPRNSGNAEKYWNILENIQDGCFEVDLHGNFTFLNDSVCRALGYSREELMKMNVRQLSDKETLKKVFQATNEVYKTGKPIKEFCWQVTRKDDAERYIQGSISLRKDSSGKPIGFLVIANDITERKMMEAEILALSITDQLTGLYNRRGFLSLAAQQLKLAKRNKGGMLLFFADLDGLKWINDTLGHEEGDKALIETATVFKETFRTSDIIARLGGDEYAALTVDITEAKSELFAARLQSLINTLNNQKNRRYRLSISVGCSYYDPENPCSLDELMAHADKSMYEQKQNKKSLLPQTVHPSSGPLDIIQR